VEAGMIKEGDWVDAYGGFGVVVKIFPEYCESWSGASLGKFAIGEKIQDSVVIKRFCSHDFKVRLQTKTMSMSLVSEIEPGDLRKIKNLLKDEKTLRKFEKYEIDDSICDVVNWDQRLSDEQFERVSCKLKNLNGNGNLRMTMIQIRNLLRDELDLFQSLSSHRDGDGKLPPRPNCYIQTLSCGLGVYENKEQLFNEIRIHKKGGSSG
jgi:hypothetical protein